MEVTALLDAAIAQTARGLQRLAIQYHLIYGSVVVVEPCQRSYHAIRHWAIEARRGFRRDSFSENLHLSFDIYRILLQRLQDAPFCEAYDASRMLLQLLLILYANQLAI